MDRNNDLLALLARVTPQYVAGFFDGEGCVYAHLGGTQARRHPGIWVSLSQNDVTPLALIALKYPGCAGPTPSKNTFTLVWSGRNCIPILEAIQDLVIVKKVQVDAGIELARLMGDHGERPNQNNLDRRRELATIIKDAKE
jgi:hypothetical protein